MTTNIVPIRTSTGTESECGTTSATTRSTTKFKFTVKRLQDLPAPGKGAKYYYDTVQAGLCIRVTTNGTKSYVLYRRINGNPERLTLGRLSGLNLQGARDAAQQLNGKIAANVDVIQERKALRAQGVTTGELFASWLRGAKTRGLRSWKGDERLWELYLKKKLSNTEAASITSLAVQRMVDAIGTKHARTANKCVALISRVFSYAIKRGMYQGNNPCRAVDRMPERSRDRFLKPDEIPKFIKAVLAEDEPWRSYFLILLYTGARRSAVLSMRWQDIDLTGGVWHVPSWDSKNGKALAIALTDEAVDLLRVLIEIRVSDWVFPSNTSGSGHVTTPTKPWERVCKRAGFDDLRIHDIRRTVGSWLAASGANGFLISKALGHLSSRSAEVYARLSVEPVRNVLGGLTKQWAGDNEK